MRFWPFKRKEKLQFTFTGLITSVSDDKIEITACGVTRCNGDALVMSGDVEKGRKYEMMSPQTVTLEGVVEWH